MTCKLGQKVQVIGHNFYYGHVGTVISTNGVIYGVRIDNGPIAPFYPAEIAPVTRQTAR
jgi:hypothetical protein